MSSSKCSFISGIFLPLNPSTTTVYARSAFYPSLRFTLSLQSAFYPWSAVRSPQSSFYTDRFESESFCNCWERGQGWTAAQGNRRKQGASPGIQISSPGSCRFPIWLPYRKTRKPWGAMLLTCIMADEEAQTSKVGFAIFAFGLLRFYNWRLFRNFIGIVVFSHSVHHGT